MSAQPERGDAGTGGVERRLWSALPPGRRAVLRRAAVLADELGLGCFLVGGAVRDLLIGRRPGQLDLLVEGDGLLFAREMGRRENARVTVHDRFLTAGLRLPTGETLDVASTRSETYPAPGALPVVRPAGLDADFHRRDFTINAIVLPLRASGFAALIDPLGGRRDLDLGLLRVLHPRSFVDDPTRAFRGARLAARLGFALEPVTEDLMKSALAAGAVGALSSGRLRHELELMAGELPLDTAVRTLGAAGLLGAIDERLRPIDRELERLRRVEEIIPSCGEPPPVEDRLVLMLGVLIAGPLTRRDGRKECEPPPAPPSGLELARRLDLRGRRRTALETIGRDAPALAAELGRPGIPGSALHARLRRVDPLVVLAAGALDPAAASTVEDWFARVTRIATTLHGRDLAGLGVPAGPARGVILRAVLDALLDGRIEGRDEELALARSLASDPGDEPESVQR